jgi:hypothetical protein
MVVSLHKQIRIKNVTVALEADQQTVDNFNGKVAATTLGVGAKEYKIPNTVYNDAGKVIKEQIGSV